MKGKYYTTKVDRLLRGKPWHTGWPRKLTDTEAAEMKHITPYQKPEPKRYVKLIHPDGTQERISWGDYISRLKKVRS